MGHIGHDRLQMQFTDRMRVPPRVRQQAGQSRQPCHHRPAVGRHTVVAGIQARDQSTATGAADLIGRAMPRKAGTASREGLHMGRPGQLIAGATEAVSPLLISTENDEAGFCYFTHLS